MKYLHYLLAAAIRRMRKQYAKTPYLGYFERSLELDEPTMVFTHDIDEGYEPNIDDMVELEKKYGVKSTMFLLAMSHPSQEWIKRHAQWDFQYHANFIGNDVKKVLQEKKLIEELVGKETPIVRAHQYHLPDLKLLQGHFTADSSYDNWTKLSLFRPFMTSLGIIEVPHLPEIEFINLHKANGDNIRKLYKEIVGVARKTNGMVVVLTHPTPFKKWGRHTQEFFLQQDGFRVRTMSQLVEDVQKKHGIRRPSS
jgi:hypothetical protein